ncbi:MAG: epoxyqueuosine reductase QueH, partial [Clostridia bacterium]
VQKVLKAFYPTVKLLVGEYDHEDFIEAISGLENESEGGVRCENCIELRLTKTAKVAKTQEFDCFDTTLSVSPHKNFEYIKKVGESLERKYGVKYLGKDFKKQDGFLKSTKLSKQYGIYRQNYCGCEFSIRHD